LLPRPWAVSDNRAGLNWDGEKMPNPPLQIQKSKIVPNL
jgi:hypothetical protein